MQRSSAGVRTLLGVSLAALVVGISAPAFAGAATPTPAPSPAVSSGLPIGVNLGPIHVDLALPLNLGGLLGGAAPSTPAAPTSSAPSTPAAPGRTSHPSDSRPAPVPTHGSARRASAVALPVLSTGTEPPATKRVTTTVTATRTAAPGRRHRAVAAPSLLQSAFQPGNPVMLLGSVVIACALGVGAVVMMAGRGRRTPRPARHSR